ncbi:MAG: Na/Pi cotransporter family protein [Caldicoprobacterales bacterium]|nr:Na/Pi cotransporter family protein [Clostridiales bacterium]
MDLSMIIMLLGGLGLFIYGMKMMGDGLEKAAGSRLKRLLEILTENRFMGLLVGTIVTAIIQSSSATTVMVVGFVNAGIMSLQQTVGVIMGANIGTTATSFLIALNLTDIAPVAIFIGVGLMLFSKKHSLRSIGEILAGFGILFMGMDLMSGSMKPLRDNATFHQIIGKVSNPFLGILTGTLMTVILQSSSASIGILQALALQGLIGLDSAIYILFGQNIGTCITALLASIGTSTNAKRAATIHLLFNTVGTFVFLIAMTLGAPFVEFIKGISPDRAVSQIANAHIGFNIINTALLFPFGNYLVKISEHLVHGKEEKYEEMRLKYLDKRILETPPIAVAQIMKEVVRMASISKNNVQIAMKAFLENDQAAIDEVYRHEDVINYLNQEITQYLVLCNGLELPERDFRLVSGLYHVVNDIERIGDHAENLVEYAEYSMEHNLSFSDMAKSELMEMTNKVMEMLENAFNALKKRDFKLAEMVLEQEEKIDDLKDRLRASHIERLNNQLCAPESGVIFLDIVSNLERVADHATNVVQSVLDEGK